MNYPLISEYIESIMSAEDNFDKLNNLRPVLDTDGLPIMSSGNFAVVFKMKDVQSGKYYAIKCFLKEQEGREENYRLIEEELEKITSPYLISIQYITKELFVDTNQTLETEFPVLLMDWIQGKPLDIYLQEILSNQYQLNNLVYQFSKISLWLVTQPFAHGDLKPDNILVQEDASLILIDYDGMYVPSMKGNKASELGSPDFRHPLRTESIFNERIDDFSLVSILLSLKAISLNKKLLNQYGAKDRLLFSEKDYRDISNSKVLNSIQQLLYDKELAQLYSFFILAIHDNISCELYHLLMVNDKKKTSFIQKQLREISFYTATSPKLLTLIINDGYRPKQMTDVTDVDLTKAYIDEFGVIYSEDRSRLLNAQECNCKDYTIKEGTKVICDEAFMGTLIMNIQIPNTITHIGNFAFAKCIKLQQIIIPESVICIGVNPFLGSYSEWDFNNSYAKKVDIQCLSPMYEIYENALYSINDKVLISHLGENIYARIFNPYDRWIAKLRIKDGTIKIGDYAFSEKKFRLYYMRLPSSIKYIGKCAFMNFSISALFLDAFNFTIEKDAFKNCQSEVIVNKGKYQKAKDYFQEVKEYK